MNSNNQLKLYFKMRGKKMIDSYMIFKIPERFKNNIFKMIRLIA